MLILLAWHGLGIDSILLYIVLCLQTCIPARTQFLLLTGVSCVLLLQALTVSFAGDLVLYFYLLRCAIPMLGLAWRC